MGRADAMSIPFVAMIGADEMAQGTIALKNMTTGKQLRVSIDEAIALIKKPVQ